MKRLLLAALAAFALAVASLDAAPRSFASISQLHILINDSDQGSCTTGLINGSQHYWLTAAHCTPEAATWTIDGFDATVVARDLDNDMAVLQTRSLVVSKVALKLAVHRPDFGDPIVIAGFPLGIGPMFAQGYVMNPGYRVMDEPRSYMFYSITACPGNSGSPVLNDHGDVVSVHQIGMGDGCTPFKGGATYEALRVFARQYFGK